MPIKDSAKKYIKVTEKKTEQNRKTRGAFRSAIKNLMDAVAEKNTKAMDEWLSKSQKTLDKAVQKNALKKNACARKKSRLNKLVKKTKQEA